LLKGLIHLIWMKALRQQQTSSATAGIKKLWALLPPSRRVDGKTGVAAPNQPTNRRHLTAQPQAYC